MTTHVTSRCGAEAMCLTYDELLARGRRVAPRHLPTRELCDVTIEVSDPADVTAYGINRPGYHPAIGAIEGLLLIAGVSDPGLLTAATPTFRRFQDGGALHGAYGPRLRTQLPVALQRLVADHDTRQAIVTVWDPLYDLYGPTTPRDLPCTLSLSLRVRDGRLTLKTHMRSNDAWRGLPYDLLQFTLLQCTLAGVLGVGRGAYVHHVDSLHLYEGDVDVAKQVSFDPATPPSITLHGVGSWPLSGEPASSTGVTERWRRVQHRAWGLLYADGVDEPELTSLTPTERWLLDRVTAVRARVREGTQEGS